jgi:hypothetical protein
VASRSTRADKTTHHPSQPPPPGRPEPPQTNRDSRPPSCQDSAHRSETTSQPDSEHDREREAAKHLHAEVGKAVSRLLRHLYFSGVVAIGLLGMIELANNYYAAFLPHPQFRRRFHFRLNVAGIDSANQWVIGTALLALVAAINIGVAVMPQPEAPWNLTGADLARRARVIVWNRCLSFAVTAAGYLSLLNAALAWTGQGIAGNWVADVVLTLLAALTMFVAANVTALADDEAETLLGLMRARERHKQLSDGLDQLNQRWPVPAPTRRTSSRRKSSGRSAGKRLLRGATSLLRPPASVARSLANRPFGRNRNSLSKRWRRWFGPDEPGRTRWENFSQLRWVRRTGLLALTILISFAAVETVFAVIHDHTGLWFDIGVALAGSALLVAGIAIASFVPAWIAIAGLIVRVRQARVAKDPDDDHAVSGAAKSEPRQLAADILRIAAIVVYDLAVTAVFVGTILQGGAWIKIVTSIVMWVCWVVLPLILIYYGHTQARGPLAGPFLIAVRNEEHDLELIQGRIDNMDRELSGAGKPSHAHVDAAT